MSLITFIILQKLCFFACRNSCWATTTTTYNYYSTTTTRYTNKPKATITALDGCTSSSSTNVSRRTKNEGGSTATTVVGA